MFPLALGGKIRNKNDEKGSIFDSTSCCVTYVLFLREAVPLEVLFK
jgi:hypothetical protein